jgi:metal-dependent amidase/aminoacylase/carboxypeptidase family protein
MAHGIVTNGGQAPNVIPARTVLLYLMRATDAASLRHLDDRMADCFLGAAIATGCDYEIVQTEPPYDELAPDKWLADVFREEMTRLGREPIGQEFEAAVPLGSTDMGNVTQVMPGIHPVVGVDAEGASVHQPGFARAAASPSGDKAVCEGAIMLARTVVALAETPAERDRVLELAARRVAS